jgi:hypothetical protein
VVPVLQQWQPGQQLQGQLRAGSGVPGFLTI